MFADTPTHDCLLMVFRGSTEMLLRAAGAEVDVDFVSVKTNIQVRLGVSDYKIITENPLLESEILYSVGEEMMGKFAPLLAQEYRRTGTITKQSSILARAQTFADRATYAALTRGKSALGGARETKINLMKDSFKCVTGLAGAAMGLASAVPTFGATSIPAIIGAWSALVTAIDVVHRACRDVETSERSAVAQVKKCQTIITDREKQKQAERTAAPQPAGSRANPSVLAGKYSKEAMHGVVKALGGYKIPMFAGHSIGLSLETATNEVAEFRRKLGNLYKTANILHDKLVHVLDMTRQMELSPDTIDTAKLEENRRFIVDVIGDGTRSVGVGAWSRGHRRKMSITWIMQYYNVRSVAAENLEQRLKDVKVSSSGSHALMREQSIDLFLTIGQYAGGKTDLMNAHSISDVASALSLLKGNGDAKGSGIADLTSTLYGWLNTAKGIKDTLSARLKQKKKDVDAASAMAEQPKSSLRRHIKSANEKANDYGATALSIGSAIASQAGA